MYRHLKISIVGYFTHREVEMNSGLSQGRSLSPTIFNIYIDKILREWLKNLELYNVTRTVNKSPNIGALIFTNCQSIILNLELSLQYNLITSPTKTKVITFIGCELERHKIVIRNVNK